MTFEQIIESFAGSDTVPVEAIGAALAAPQAFVGEAVRLLEGIAEGTVPRERWGCVCVLAHVLGEIGDERAFRPLLGVLTLPGDVADELFGDALTASVGSILIALMGEDQAALERVMLDTAIDQFVRDSCFTAWTYAALTGRIGRDHAYDFLATYFSRTRLRRNDFGFSSWTEAATFLRFAELTGQARRHLPVRVPGRRVWEQPTATFRDFADLLARAERDPDGWRSERRLQPFESTIGELSSWYGYSEEFRRRRAEAALREERERSHADPDLFDEPPGAFNPYRDVGRNDPCPCGSGKKFKKCCLS